MAKSTSELREYWTEVFQSHFKIKREDAKVLFLTCSHFLKDTHLSEPVILKKIKSGDIPGIQGETIRDWVIRTLNPRNESKTLERRLRRLEEKTLKNNNRKLVKEDYSHKYSGEQEDEFLLSLKKQIVAAGYDVIYFDWAGGGKAYSFRVKIQKQNKDNSILLIKEFNPEIAMGLEPFSIKRAATLFLRELRQEIKDQI